GHYERLPTLMADLLSRHVTVIAANAPAAVAAKATTTSIPVVFVTAADPVKIGFVASLNRPGGNLTGVALLSVELAATGGAGVGPDGENRWAACQLNQSQRRDPIERSPSCGPRPGAATPRLARKQRKRLR